MSGNRKNDKKALELISENFIIKWFNFFGR